MTIALRMVQQAARLDYAGRLPQQRDAGSQAVAKALIVQLRLQGWKVHRLTTPLPPAKSR